MADKSKCNKCGKDVYWFTSKKTGKNYPCSSDSPTDFHSQTCGKTPVGGGQTTIIPSSATAMDIAKTLVEINDKLKELTPIKAILDTILTHLVENP